MPRRSRKAAASPARKKSTTGFSAIVRGVAEAAIHEKGVGASKGSLPDIEIGEATPGRETLALIDESVVPRPAGVRVSSKSQKVVSKKRRVDASLPDISVDYRPGGRETMAAIEDELEGSEKPHADEEPTTGVRTKMTTLGFEERPTRDSKGRLLSDSAPEVITVEEGPIGRATLEAIAAEARGSDVTIENASRPLTRGTMDLEEDEVYEDGEPASSPGPREPVVHELVTYVVEGLDLEKMKSQDALKAFVASQLMHRLPIWSADDLARVDLTPADGGRFAVLQIWCRLAPKNG